MNTLTLALCQLRPVPGHPEENAEKICSVLRSAAGKSAQLLLLPECSATGYDVAHAAELAILADSAALETVRRTARELNVACCFGYFERDGQNRYITQEIAGGGAALRYRKTHLGERERAVFTPGDALPLTEVFGVRAGVQLCWESHIPDISTVYRRGGAELLLFPYASGMSGTACKERFSVHLPARASDNGCFAAACNLLLPGEGKGGGMAVYGPKGRELAACWSDREELMTVTLSGTLPRENAHQDMHSISYFDRRREELFNRQEL